MVNIVYKLEDAVDIRLSKTSDMQAIAAGDHAVMDACRDIRKDAPLLYKQIGHLDMACAEFRRYHKKVITQHDRLFNQAPGSRAMWAVQRLLADHEEAYKDDIDPHLHLPLHYQEKIAVIVQDLLPLILKGLREKMIPQPILHEIARGFEQAQKSNQNDKPCYGHHLFLPELADELLLLAQDKRKKDWQGRLLTKLISYNFNYLGFYNTCARTANEQLAKENSISGKLALLLQWQEDLHHIVPQEGKAYAPGKTSLLEHFKIYLIDRREEYAVQKHIEAIKEENTVQTFFAADDMTLDLHCRYKVGIYKGKSKEEAAEKYANVYRTKDGKRISAHTIGKFYSPELQAAGFRRLKKIHEEEALIKKELGL